MKGTLRIPTTESYAYIEVEVEKESAVDIISEYRRITKLVQGEFGLEDKEFNRVLDNYIWGTKTMEAHEYEGMSPSQQETIQTIKRSRKRNEYKSKKV